MLPMHARGFTITSGNAQKIKKSLIYKKEKLTAHGFQHPLDCMPQMNCDDRLRGQCSLSVTTECLPSIAVEFNNLLYQIQNHFHPRIQDRILGFWDLV
jgi:hypothetical protein